MKHTQRLFIYNAVVLLTQGLQEIHETLYKLSLFEKVKAILEENTGNILIKDVCHRDADRMS